MRNAITGLRKALARLLRDFASQIDPVASVTSGVARGRVRLGGMPPWVVSPDDVRRIVDGQMSRLRGGPITPGTTYKV